jgi:hypothetical protein
MSLGEMLLGSVIDRTYRAELARRIVMRRDNETIFVFGEGVLDPISTLVDFGFSCLEEFSRLAHLVLLSF